MRDDARGRTVFNALWRCRALLSFPFLLAFLLLRHTAHACAARTGTSKQASTRRWSALPPASRGLPSHHAVGSRLRGRGLPAVAIADCAHVRWGLLTRCRRYRTRTADGAGAHKVARNAGGCKRREQGGCHQPAKRCCAHLVFLRRRGVYVQGLAVFVQELHLCRARTLPGLDGQLQPEHSPASAVIREDPLSAWHDLPPSSGVAAASELPEPRPARASTTAEAANQTTLWRLRRPVCWRQARGSIPSRRVVATHRGTFQLCNRRSNQVQDSIYVHPKHSL